MAHRLPLCRRLKNFSFLLTFVTVVVLYMLHRFASVDEARQCNLEYINSRRLEQDDPCIIEIIRNDYLRPPPATSAPYQLDHFDSPSSDPSPGQAAFILRLLANKTNGFFIECGAWDGELMSNTLYMERSLHWTGLLIEANPYVFGNLVKRNRKAWTSPVCLSLEPYPTRVSFQAGLGDNSMSGFIDRPGSLQLQLRQREDEAQWFTIQCFPLYSILLAVGQTSVDYFSLDIEGHELKVLKTIPWAKVDIKTLSVEHEHILQGEQTLVSFMEDNGYVKVASVDYEASNDTIFAQKGLE